LRSSYGAHWRARPTFPSSSPLTPATQSVSVLGTGLASTPIGLSHLQVDDEIELKSCAPTHSAHARLGGLHDDSSDAADGPEMFCAGRQPCTARNVKPRDGHRRLPFVVERWSDTDAVRGEAGIHARRMPCDWRAVDPRAMPEIGSCDVHGIVERFGRYVLGTEGWRARPPDRGNAQMPGNPFSSRRSGDQWMEKRFLRRRACGRTGTEAEGPRACVTHEQTTESINQKRRRGQTKVIVWPKVFFMSARSVKCLMPETDVPNS
jgi:hypothetical protein